jgi:cell division protein FtsW
MSKERLSRLDFFEPCLRYAGDGYHLCWSLMAIGSGGLFGKGLGASSTKLSYLPEAHTDFIFAILAEELGILGVFFIIALFYLFVKKCFFIGEKSFRVGLVFQGYLSYAIGIFISLQAFLNMAVNLGIVPTKGLALPFFSYGGSNYLVSILSITIILRIYRDVYKKSLNSSLR